MSISTNNTSIIDYEPNGTGTIWIPIHIQRRNKRDMDSVMFKVDTGAELTVVTLSDLLDLGYTIEELKVHPAHGGANTAVGEYVSLRYISNVTLLLNDLEITNCNLHFSLENRFHRNLIGMDILELFDIMISQSTGELKLYRRERLHLFKPTGPNASDIHTLTQPTLNPIRGLRLP